MALLIALLATTGSGMTLYALHEGKGPFASFVAKSTIAAPRTGVSEKEARDEGKEDPGVEAWEEIHETFANVTLVLVILHIAGVALASISHRENLVAAMFNGRKRREPHSQK